MRFIGLPPSSSQESVCQQEMVNCRLCSRSTRQHDYVTHFYDVLAVDVEAEEHRLPGRRLGQMLQALQNASRQTCDVDKGTAACSYVGQYAKTGRVMLVTLP